MLDKTLLLCFIVAKVSTLLFQERSENKSLHLGISPKQPEANNKMGSESSYLTNFAKFPAVSGAEYPSIMTYISKQSAPNIILQMSICHDKS